MQHHIIGIIANGTGVGSYPEHMRRDLAAMMYGLGDDRNPFTETVDLVEDLVMEYMSELTLEAGRVSCGERADGGEHRIRRPRSESKCSRIQELMTASQDLRVVRRAFHVER